MSGGCFGYLCYKEPLDLPNSQESILSMAERLKELGSEQAAEETKNLITLIQEYEAAAALSIERLKDLWKAVEWHDSGDWGIEDIEEQNQKYHAI